MLIASLLLGWSQKAAAQGTIQFLRTGSGQVLVTFRETVTIPLTGAPPFFLEFGFATEEVLSPGTIFDAFTVSLENVAGPEIAILATADASGVVWAPPTPGTLEMDPADIQRTPAVFPSLQPVFPHSMAFQVTLPVPAPFLGKSVNVVFDLFDNQDSRSSIGYFIGLPIPESSPWALLTGGALLLTVRRRAAAR